MTRIHIIKVQPTAEDKRLGLLIKLMQTTTSGVKKRLCSLYWASFMVPAPDNNRLLIYKQKLEITICNPKIQHDVSILRTKYAIPIAGFASDTDFLNWLKHLPRGYDNDIRLLLKKYRINLRWQKSLEFFLLFNNTKPLVVLPCPAVVKIMEDVSFGEGRQLAIQISKEATKEDLLKAWNEVLEWQAEWSTPDSNPHEIDLSAYIAKKQHQVERPIRPEVFKRYRRAYELRQEKMPGKEIASTLKSESLVNTCTYKDVENYISEFKTLIARTNLD